MQSLNREIVLGIMNNFMDAWNSGNLEKSCEIYGSDATFLDATTIIYGKKNILEFYRTKFPDASSMGNLRLELLEFRTTPDPNPLMATAILRWTLKYSDGNEQSGYCLETYVSSGGQIQLAQDATL